MNKTTRAMILLTATAPLLAGCGSLLTRLGLAGPRVPVNVATAPDGHADLALGRQALAEGHYARAIAAFRMARLDPAHAAEATNGLGVSYAMIGREDLAARFFAEAVARAPGDPRFAANLSRLHDEQLAGMAASAPVAASRPGELGLQQPGSRQHGPVRTSTGGGNRTVTVTHAAAAAPFAASVVQVTPGRVRVRWSQPEAARPDYALAKRGR
jgi:tetratricopeptide (TPR) repeat protein